MCGIAGIHVKDRGLRNLPLDNLVDMLLLGIEPRGTHATGMVSVSRTGKRVVMDKRPVSATEFIGGRKTIPTDARTILLHTRFATQGKPENNNNNHPVLWGTCFAVHNGHINNDSQPFVEHDLERGETEVDSIAIPALLSHHGMAEFDNIKEALKGLKGSWAIAAIDPVNTPDRLLLAKGNSSPLVVLNTRNCIIWASTKQAILDAWAVCIGSPPEKFVKEGQPMGWDNLSYGEAYLIDGNTSKATRWTEKYSDWSGNSIYGFSSYGWEDDDDDWETEYKNGVWVTKKNTRLRPLYLCAPYASGCDFPCTVGCQSSNCLCTKGTFHMKKVQAQRILTCDPSPYNCDDKTCWRAKSANNYCHLACDCVALIEDGAEYDGPVDVECQGCDVWVPDTDITLVKIADVVWDLCPSCADSIEGDEEVVEEGESCGVQVEASTKLYEIPKHKWSAAQKAAHMCAIRELAKEMDATKDFLEWAIFDAVSTDGSDSWVRDVQNACRKEYGNALKIVKEVYGGPDFSY